MLAASNAHHLFLTARSLCRRALAARSRTPRAAFATARAAAAAAGGAGGRAMDAAAGAAPAERGQPGEVPPARNVHVQPGEELDMDEYNDRWHKIWREGLQPGQRFDAGRASPLLQRLLSSGDAPAAGARVLVPGCGRGYDVIAAADAGAALAVGLDISEAAVAAAEALRGGALAPGAAARAQFESCDFFTYKHPGGLFDLGYDYTFLCALPPQARGAWAAAWAAHLAAGGQLVTLIFPVDPEADPGAGPPFPVTPELYESLLLPTGFECIELKRVPDALSHPQRAGREWLGRWRAPGPGAAASKF
ncbi:MAG: S-adenosyl-L-methionine-dependent methyltransferase [Monoraphidium minutum]|nr:MAG: S-adenosyl-L-methionine-dependent methyltransferase [Monoraphidium minutum]